MDKQESSELDITRWVIVHETPFMGWLGRLDDGFFEPGAYDERLADALLTQRPTLHEALVLQTTMMPVPAGGERGPTMRMGITTSVTAPHQFTTESLLITVAPQKVTLVRDLNAADQVALFNKIQGVRAQQLAQRASALGIAMPPTDHS